MDRLDELRQENARLLVSSGSSGSFSINQLLTRGVRTMKPVKYVFQPNYGEGMPDII